MSLPPLLTPKEAEQRVAAMSVGLFIYGVVKDATHPLFKVGRLRHDGTAQWATDNDPGFENIDDAWDHAITLNGETPSHS